MSQIGGLMALFLQERERERSSRTILELLSERRMDGPDRLRRRRSLQERLGLVGMVCCGSSISGSGPSNMGTQSDTEEDDMDPNRTPPEMNSDPDCIVASPRMNLAAALAAERHFRTMSVAADGGETGSPNDESTPRGSTVEAATPLRVSLMRLLEESDGQEEKAQEIEGAGRDLMCCVCMERKKGAAFIPCGHTFCRVCSRELWLNRGSCPLCNRSILEILDIY